MDLNAINELGPSVYLTRLKVNPLRDFANVFVDDGVKASLRKNVDQHGDGQRILKQRIFRVDVRPTRQCVPR